MAGDTLAYSMGAAISHVPPNGMPSSFFIAVISSSGMKLLSFPFLFGVKCFHSYLYGQHFTLVSDYKPLTAVLVLEKGIPPLAVVFPV